jgi:site-specific DNA recombinase
MRKRSKRKPDRPLRIAGYVRVSSQRQATEGDSLVAQEHEIEQEVEFRTRRENWNVVSLEFYIDAGKSAKDQNRPQLQRLKRDIAAGKIDIVICFKLDRITRSLKDFVDLWALFEDHDVDVISLREKFDTSMPTGEAMVQLIMVFAQLERKMTAERTYSIMRDRVERGLWNGGHILGYRSKPDEPGQLEVEEDAAAIVRQIFDWFEELGSSGAVTRRLSDTGIRYPSYKTRSGKQRGGNLFAKQKVTGILRNPVYIGQIRWGDAVHDGNHPPIISSEQFERVQVKLGEVARRRTGLKAKPKGRHYLLTGVIRCSCGAHMVGYSTSGRNRTHFYYACTRQNHEGGQYSCSAPRIPAEAIEVAIIGRIREISRSVEARERIVDQALSQLDNESEKLRHEEDLLRRQQQKTKADIGRLVEVLKSLGAKGLPSVQSELSRLETEERGLHKQLRELAKRQEPLSRITDDAKAFIRNWGDVGELLDSATEEERMLLIRHYVEVVELHAADPKGRTGTYAMRLFPEIRPDRGFDWGEKDADNPPNGGSHCPETTNGDPVDQDGTAESLTDSRLVCISDGKAPPVGLEPTTRRLTAACSTN